MKRARAPHPGAPRRPGDPARDLARAVELHQAGRIAEAEALYRSVLSRAPDHPDALHLLGLAAYQRGDHARAVELIGRALARRPGHAAAHTNLGNALLALGRAEEALASHQRALHHAPGDPLVLNNFGNALLALRRPAEAAEAYRAALARLGDHPAVRLSYAKALAAAGDPTRAAEEFRRLVSADPAAVEGWVGLGNAQLALDDLAQAEAAYLAALRLSPADGGANTGFGVVALRTGRAEAALPALARALEAAPGSALALSNLGAALRAAGRADEALPLLRAALAADAGLADAHCNLGALLLDRGEAEEALQAFRSAAELEPRSYEARANVAAALCDLGRYDEGEMAARQAVSLAPDRPGAYATLGRALGEQGRSAEAAEACRRALALDPACADAHWNLALVLLRRGEYAEGWREYEWRFEAVRRRLRPPPLGVPRWAGEPPEGRAVLAYWEQGLGDTIQFARFLPELARRGARVILECQPPLVRLLERLPGVAAVVPTGADLPPADCQVPLMSLPHLLGVTLEGISGAPYLRTPEGARGAALPPSGRRRIGLVWAGSAAHTNDRNRSCGLGALAPLFGAVGSEVEWVSLQVGPRARDLADARPAVPVRDVAGGLGDFADTAAVVAGLDLVITVDTAVAHLAGALGTPAWVLLPHVPDWRWLTERNDTPWYSAARLFRQPARGDWATVVSRVADALAAWAENPSTRVEKSDA